MSIVSFRVHFRRDSGTTCGRGRRGCAAERTQNYAHALTRVVHVPRCGKLPRTMVCSSLAQGIEQHKSQIVNWPTFRQVAQRSRIFTPPTSLRTFPADFAIGLSILFDIGTLPDARRDAAEDWRKPCRGGSAARMRDWVLNSSTKTPFVGGQHTLLEIPFVAFSQLVESK